MSALILFRAIFASVILVISFPPVGIYILSPLALIIFLRPLLRPVWSKKSIFLYSFSYSFFTFCFAYYWLAHTFNEFGELPWVVAILLSLLCYVLASLFSGFYFLSWRWVYHRFQLEKWKTSTLLGVFFLVVWLWDQGDTRLFPWHPFMSFGENNYLIAAAYYLKEFGWNLLFYIIVFAFVGYEFNKAQQKRTIISLLTSVVLLVAVGFLGNYQITESKKLHPESQPVALLQGNVGNFDKKLSKLKVMPTIRNVLAIYRDLVEEAAVEFKELADQLGAYPEPWIFWPETSFPGFPLNDSGMNEQMKEWARLSNGLHLVGAYEEKMTPFAGQEVMLDYNVVLFYHEKLGLVNHYQKFVRMPFGEYVPGDSFYPEIYKKIPVFNHFGKGTEYSFFTHPDKDGPIFIPLICYEVLMNGFVSDFIAAARDSDPSRQIILVNPTNDSWFGKSSEPFLHAILSRWQAAQHGVALVRVTNTGISMVVAPWGELLTYSPFDQEMVLFGYLPVKKRVLLEDQYSQEDKKD